MRVSRSLLLASILSALLSTMTLDLLADDLNPGITGYGRESREISAAAIEAKVSAIYEEFGFRLRKGRANATRLIDMGGENILHTGGGFHNTDIELFIRISELFPARSIFIIGNGFGYSTFCLSEIFKGAAVDVIDAEIEGADNQRGSEITREIGRKYYPNVRLTIGFSPQDTPKAARPEIRNKLMGYDLVFIDGRHTNAQMAKDFVGVLPFLSQSCVVVFHDVGLYKMDTGFAIVEKRARAVGFDSFIKTVESTAFGTGVAIRGVDALKTALDKN